MRREHLVGVALSGDAGELLLTEFLGEGAEGVVYAVEWLTPAPAELAGSEVIKLFKGMALLEMDTLHHGAWIHEERYPGHPLRCTAERRLELLTTEMLAKIDNPHLIFRIELFRRILEDVVAVVLPTLGAEVFPRGESLESIVDGAVREWIDDNALRMLDDALEDDLVVDEHRALVEALRAAAEAYIARARAAGTYFPMTRNPFFQLLGLHAEDFINLEELRHISETPQFRSRLTQQHRAGLFDLIATLYYHLEGRQERGIPLKPEHGHSDVDIAVVACQLLERFGDTAQFGLAKMWTARLRQLEGAQADITEPLLLSALESFSRRDDLADRHDALNMLARLYQHSDPQRMVGYLNEALRIRQLLEPGWRPF